MFLNESGDLRVGRVVVSALAVLFLIFALVLSASCYTSIPAGQVGVGTTFGKTSPNVFTEGFNLKSPLMDITLFDARQKTHKESMSVPSQDQLLTTFHISIQYRLIKDKAPSMLMETGSPADVLAVHMIPQLRSRLREMGKGYAKAEMFFDKPVQQAIQTELLSVLKPLSSKGIEVQQLLLRNVVLPKILTDAVARKKLAAQNAEKAIEELKKFTVDQKQKDAAAEAAKRAEIIDAEKKRDVMLISANAKLEAAKIDAQATIVEAEARAMAKKEQIDVVGLQAYVKLESMKSLEKFQGGNHMVIMDPNTTNPIPFMNLGK